MDRWILDRVENGFAVMETPQHTFMSFPLTAFSGETAREGGVYEKRGDGTFQLLAEETENRKKSLYASQEKIFHKP